MKLVRVARLGNDGSFADGSCLLTILLKPRDRDDLHMCAFLLRLKRRSLYGIVLFQNGRLFHTLRWYQLPPFLGIV